MKNFFFGLSLLGFILALFGLAWQYESTNSLEKDIALLKAQNNDLAREQLRTKQFADQQYAFEIGSIKNTVQALGQTVTQSNTKLSLLELEKMYKNGEKNFLYACGGMKGISSKELFAKPYFDDLTRAIVSIRKPFSEPEGFKVPDEMSLVYPWGPRESFEIISVCEDGDILYLFAQYRPDSAESFFGVATYSIKSKEIGFVSTGLVKFFLKEIVKDKNIIRFMPDELCFGEGGFYARCDSQKASQPPTKIPQAQILFNLEDKTFTVVNP